MLFQSTGARLAKVSCDVGSGNVTLRLGPQGWFAVLADTESGDLVNRFGDTQAVLKGREVIGYRRGDARIQVKVSSESGHIVVEPGTGASVEASSPQTPVEAPSDPWRRGFDSHPRHAH